MLIKTRIYVLAVMLILLPVVILIYSLRNKNAALCKFLIAPCVVGILYLFTDLVFMGEYLAVGIGLEILYLYIGGLFAGLMYVIDVVINVKKRKSITKTYFATKFVVPKPFKIMLAIFIILPILFLLTGILRDRILLKNSDAVVVFDSRGNGGIGDGATFGFAIQGNKCKRFDLHVEYGVEKLLPEGAVEGEYVWTHAQMGTYQAYVEDKYITIWNGDQVIFQFDADAKGYFNIDVEECYYVMK